MEQNKPLVSVIMPAYNAAKFISRAIDSVLSQTYKNIELVIVDDASTDNTCKIVEKYNDNRIKLIKDKVNSGSAYIPRYHAFTLSAGEYVLNLDSDDYLESKYVEHMVTRFLQSQADVCCGWMVLIDENEQLLGEDRCVPKSCFDFSCEMNGREAFLNTVPEWKLSMAGCLATRDVWNYGYKRTYKTTKRGIHDDENVSRYMLLYAKKVAFIKKRYFYTMHRASVTHVFNDETYSFMDSIDDLSISMCDEFGKDSQEFLAAKAFEYNAFSHVMERLIEASNNLNDSDLDRYLSTLKKWHKRLNWLAIGDYTCKYKLYVKKTFLLNVIIRVIRKKYIGLARKLSIIIHTYYISKK